MSNSYFRSKMDADDKKALSELKKMQPGFDWDESKYIKSQKPEVYNSYKISNEHNSPYYKALNKADRNNLEKLQESNPSFGWTPEIYLRNVDEEKYISVKNEADKFSKNQGKFRDKTFYDNFDEDDKKLFRHLKRQNPGYLAEDLFRQSYEEKYYAKVCKELEDFNSGELFYGDEEPNIQDEPFNGNDDDEGEGGTGGEGDADAEY